MNSDNYRARRTKLLYDVGLHQCLYCGHPGSRENLLEFHHINKCGNTHCGGRQQLIKLEQDWFEWTHFHTPEHALIVLCHTCHMDVHNEPKQRKEEKEDEQLFFELSRYRFCVNKNVSCSYKSCQLCDEYRSFILDQDESAKEPRSTII